MRLLKFKTKALCLHLSLMVVTCAVPGCMFADDGDATTNSQQGAQQEAKPEPAEQSPAAQGSPAEEQVPKPAWKYSGFLDFGYLLDFNHPANHLFRDRGTTFKVNELDLNMAGGGVKKEASPDSRWGVELEAQAGKDSANFGFSATEPNIGGAEVLRHFGAANVSYLAPVGKGLTLQAGIFGSLIGYDSLYTKDNFNYTRPWGADYTPYLMMGVNASHPFSKKLTATGFVTNDYFHLADPNSVPSFGGQLTFAATEHLNLKETLLYGPHQSDTAVEFWRFFSDSIAEWKKERFTTAFEYQIGTERVSAPGTPRALWMFAQLPFHRMIAGPWSATVRPEVAWDRDGRWTGSKQTIKALTATLEYRLPYWKTNTIARLEYRVDDSRGPGGGFFRGAQISPGVVALVPTQQLLAVGVIFTFESR